ncbi:Transglutaminase-like superfamily protein [Planctomycetes bacterium Pan216]|uniref:Transglutaminase-like superfamily protein n=1 Tax=Kolteria novifilia TaxID=2527975 RepID=A0A518B4U1_9BACT|nr:Transglutaminase-like superfamily protein [Planctomycetes bacterium Pan216]
MKDVLQVAPANTETRYLRCRHRTTYTYGGPVSNSRNLLRLMPRTDRRQRVESFCVATEPKGVMQPFDDAFGNYVLDLSIETEHSTLTIESTSRIEVHILDPFGRISPNHPLCFPVTWTEIESQVLQPYFGTGVGSSSAWTKIIDHAQQRAIENNYNVTETLFNWNLEIFRNFEYTPGVTDTTTPVTTVFETQQGVCQDFASLFIAWARAFGLPARYVWGYMLVGEGDTLPVGAGATHAWAEVFLPKIGWTGFDPTNGVLADDKYVAVAHGRDSSDSPPILGEINPPQTQTLSIEVDVTPADASVEPPPAEVSPK